ncbi:stress response protein nst1-like [Teleopsis dalmanni]|uniref:stress response protein nst1-like n=1 Tax=Teleopsis dalmanni TaxID=139649 RepID=UPI0018CF09CA|nr:stress response protein nst1-like [Teleopsis dalmanni]
MENTTNSVTDADSTETNFPLTNDSLNPNDIDVSLYSTGQCSTAYSSELKNKTDGVSKLEDADIKAENEGYKHMPVHIKEEYCEFIALNAESNSDLPDPLFTSNATDKQKSTDQTELNKRTRKRGYNRKAKTCKLDKDSTTSEDLETTDLNLDNRRSLVAKQTRDRRARETPEQTESRLLRQRVATMKKRLLQQLKLTEDEWNVEKQRKTVERRLSRQKQRENETPEQTAERKRRQAQQKILSRHRLEASETPEETAARLALQREYQNKRSQIRKSKETPEQRAKRKAKEQYYRDLTKQRKLADPSKQNMDDELKKLLK